MYDVFENRNISYNLRSQTHFMRAGVNTSDFGINLLKYLAIKVWDSVNQLKYCSICC